MKNQNKPIAIEKYRCPKCNETFECTYQKAQEHVNQPIDTPLSHGLILRFNGRPTEYIVITGNSNELGIDHGILHTSSYYFYIEEGKIHSLGEQLINSKEVKSEMEKNHSYFILNKEEFNKIKKDITNNFPSKHNDNFIRTTSELEALANNGK